MKFDSAICSYFHALALMGCDFMTDKGGKSFKYEFKLRRTAGYSREASGVPADTLILPLL